VVKKVQPTNWLSQGTKAFANGAKHGHEEFNQKYAAILGLLQSDNEIAEAAAILKNARMLEGARAGRFVSEHKMKSLQESNFKTFELSGRGIAVAEAATAKTTAMVKDRSETRGDLRKTKRQLVGKTAVVESCRLSRDAAKEAGIQIAKKSRADVKTIQQSSDSTLQAAGTEHEGAVKASVASEHRTMLRGRTLRAKLGEFQGLCIQLTRRIATEAIASAKQLSSLGKEVNNWENLARRYRASGAESLRQLKAFAMASKEEAGDQSRAVGPQKEHSQHAQL
jgi:hypothetical protein